MGTGYLLAGRQYARVAPPLTGREGTKGGRGYDKCCFVEALLWLLRNDRRWRALISRVRQLIHYVYAFLALARFGRDGLTACQRRVAE